MRTSPSTDLNGPRLSVVSNQSTARPSCVISLAEIADSECVCCQRGLFFSLNPILSDLDERTTNSYISC